MEIFEWKKNGKKKYSKLSSVKSFYYGNFWIRKNREKKVFKIVLSKEFLLYKKNNGKIFLDEKKTKSESHYFFYIVKTFYQGKFWILFFILLWEFLNEKKLEKKVFKIVLSKKFLLWEFLNEKKLEKKSIQNCPQ
jgi:hypothetical protein